jgi:hypothetical protein
MKAKEITINNIDYKIKTGFGVMMLWEKEENKAITEAAGRQDIMKLAYHSLQYNNDNFNWTYKEFVDEILDNNPALFIEIINIITELLFTGDTESTVKKK